MYSEQLNKAAGNNFSLSSVCVSCGEVSNLTDELWQMDSTCIILVRYIASIKDQLHSENTECYNVCGRFGIF